jgi:preprotein translocase subunit YajC
MHFRHKIVVSTVAALFTFAAPVVAQDAVAPSVQIQAGAMVTDTDGGEVGTITSVDGDFVILRTDRHEVRLPATSFATGDDGFVMAMTRAQVNEAVEHELANQGPIAAIGATVQDTSGATVGTITEADDQHATLRLQSNRLVRLPLTAFARGPSGPVIAMSAAELEAAAVGATE